MEPRYLLSGGDIPPVPVAAGRWSFDEGAGTLAADTTANGFNAALGTNTSWVAGKVGTNALHVNGTASAVATITGPVVDTSASFTVSAWVNLSALGGFQTVVSTSGTRVSGFYLGLRGDTGTFCFARIASDATNGAAVAASSAAPVVGTWYHIVGVDDVSTGTLSIYVDGQLQGSAAYAGGWKATGDTLIGHGFYNGGQVDYVNGSIDEVSMYSNALTAAQVAALDHPADYNFEDGGGASASDVSGHGNTAALNSGASWTAGRNGTYGLALNGSANGFASNASAVVNTAQPFSISAWVKLNSLAGYQSIASIDGANSSGFYLQLRGDTGKFAFTRLGADASNATAYHADASSSPTLGKWYHLLGVNDVANGTILLYVDGALQASVTAPTGWQATGATVIGAAKSAGTRTQFLSGAVDDVRFYNSPLSATAAGFLPYLDSGIQSILNIAGDTTGITTSPDLFGAFMEDINYGGEGGIYNDEVRNSGFNDSSNALNAWSALTGSGVTAALTSDATTGPTSALTKSGKLTVTSGVSASARVGIANSGYFGVAVAPSTTYSVEFYAKASSGFTGPLTVTLESNTGTVYGSAAVSSITTSWTKYTVSFTTGSSAPTSATNRFVISTTSASANGRSIWIGSAHLFPPAYQGKSNHLRVDLMEKLAALKPAIFRVPGGNYLEGNTYADRFNWSKTIGRLEDRPGHYNSAWGYWSTDGMGLDEYLQMAEEVGARPIVGVYAGYTLNGTSDTGSVLTADVTDAVNELHYILDPVTTTLGALRAANGHAAPYDVREVEIGNEDWFSSTYPTRYPLFYDAIHAAFPSLKIIASHTATGGRPYDIVDEHFYNSAGWFQSNQGYYDNRSRAGAKVFVGEYAAREGSPTNTLAAALGDATWLMGLERNSDVVTMSSYAPIWANVNGIQWTPDLIGFDNNSSFGSPSYWAQVMLSNNRGEQVVSSSLSGTGALRTLVTKTGNQYYLTVVNVGGVSNTAAINLSGIASILPNGQMITLTGPSGTSMNSIATPELIAPVTSSISGLGVSFTRTFAPYSLTILKLTAGTVTTPTLTRVSSVTLQINAPRQAIQFGFSGAVTESTLTSDDLIVQNVTMNQTLPSSAVLVTSAANGATFSFVNLPGEVLPDGNYHVIFNGDTVLDVNQSPIDANGDGVAGGSIAFDFFFLNADGNRDRKVDTSDFNLLAGSFGSTGKVFSEGNFNYDAAGTVNSEDFNLLIAQYGKSLPAGAPSIPAASPLFSSPNDSNDSSWRDGIL